MSRQSFFMFSKSLSTRKRGKAKPAPIKAEQKHQMRYTSALPKHKPINETKAAQQKNGNEFVS